MRLVVTTIFSVSFGLVAATQDEITFPVTPLQNTFLVESPMPQELRQVQAKLKNMVTATEPSALNLDADIEYGLTRRSWLGPTASYEAKNDESGLAHAWDIGFALGYNFVQRDRFLLSALTQLGYGDEKLLIKPTLSMFKSVAALGFIISGSSEIHPMGKEIDVHHEIGFALFSNCKTVSPLFEAMLEMDDEGIKPSIAPSLLFLAVPGLEIGIGAQLHLPDPSTETAIMISLLAEFDT